MSSVGRFGALIFVIICPFVCGCTSFAVGQDNQPAATNAQVASWAILVGGTEDTPVWTLVRLRPQKPARPGKHSFGSACVFLNAQLKTDGSVIDGQAVDLLHMKRWDLQCDVFSDPVQTARSLLACLQKQKSLNGQNVPVCLELAPTAKSLCRLNRGIPYAPEGSRILRIGSVNPRRSARLVSLCERLAFVAGKRSGPPVNVEAGDIASFVRTNILRPVGVPVHEVRVDDVLQWIIIKTDDGVRLDRIAEDVLSAPRLAPRMDIGDPVEEPLSRRLGSALHNKQSRR